jgi:threonine/homoserine/homoserine lactone efflux protein
VGKLPKMTWATYGGFLAFATVLVLIPGPDFAVVGGWRQGFLSNITNPKVLSFCLAVLLGFSARLAVEHA